MVIFILHAVRADEGTSLNAGGLAVHDCQLAVDVDILRLAFDFEAFVGSMVHVLVLVGGRNGPLDAGIPDGDIRIGANLQAALLGVQVEQLGRIFASPT